MDDKKLRKEITGAEVALGASAVITIITSPIVAAAFLYAVKLLIYSIVPKSKVKYITQSSFSKNVFKFIEFAVSQIDKLATKYIGWITKILKVVPSFKGKSEDELKHYAVTIYYTFTVGAILKIVKFLSLSKGVPLDSIALTQIRQLIVTGLHLGSHGLNFDDMEKESNVIFSNKKIAPLIKELIDRVSNVLGVFESVEHSDRDSITYRDFYKELINESMTATISEKDYEAEHLQDLLGISYELMAKVVTPIFNALSSEEQKYFRDNRKFMDFLTPDGGDEFKSEGTINFYISGFKPDVVEKILKGIQYFAPELNIVLGNISAPAPSKLNSLAQVIRIPVVKNNNTESFERIPEVQFSNTNARLIFGRILQLPDFDEGYTISAVDLLNAIAAVEKKDQQDDEYLYRYSRPESKDSDGGATMITGGVNPEYIRDKLNSLKDLCNYAIDNDVKDIVIN